jgi:HsdM N-terminal domain
MALKKSDLYSSLWASCDELRGGMDASQSKDYVLFMLFIKYISDKYGDSDDFALPVVIPKGASFKDMVALKGNSDIGSPGLRGTSYSGNPRPKPHNPNGVAAFNTDVRCLIVANSPQLNPSNSTGLKSASV